MVRRATLGYGAGRAARGGSRAPPPRPALSYQPPGARRPRGPRLAPTAAELDWIERAEPPAPPDLRRKAPDRAPRSARGPRGLRAGRREARPDAPPRATSPRPCARSSASAAAPSGADPGDPDAATGDASAAVPPSLADEHRGHRRRRGATATRCGAPRLATGTRAARRHYHSERRPAPAACLRPRRRRGTSLESSPRLPVAQIGRGCMACEPPPARGSRRSDNQARPERRRQASSRSRSRLSLRRRASGGLRHRTGGVGSRRRVCSTAKSARIDATRRPELRLLDGVEIRRPMRERRENDVRSDGGAAHGAAWIAAVGHVIVATCDFYESKSRRRDIRCASAPRRRTPWRTRTPPNRRYGDAW